MVSITLYLQLQYYNLHLIMISMLRNAPRPALLTFIGTALIKLATGMIGIWGNTNIYYFSYLHHHGTNITNFTNSILLLCTIIPSSLAMLVATRLTGRYGYKYIIKICAIIFGVMPLMINFKLSLFMLGMCYLFIPVTCFSISSIPVLNCLWSQFPKDLNKVSGSAVLFFALGMIMWNLIFLAIVNPQNQQAVIDQNNQAYFSEEVAGRVFTACSVLAVCSGVLFGIGAMLVEKREVGVDRDRLTQDSPPQFEVRKSEQVLTMTSSPKKQTAVKLKLKSVLADNKFLILFFISLLTPLYLIYLVLYMKLIFMPIINDDHYLAFCSVVLTLSAVIGAPFWGLLGDKIGFKNTLLSVLVFDFVVKVGGLWCKQKYNLWLMYFLLGFNDKGILTIIGPGLIQIFGLEMATQLIPYKGLSVFIAYIIVPVTQLAVSTYMKYQHILAIFIVGSVGAVSLGYYFWSKIHYVPFLEKQGKVKQEIQKVGFQMAMA